MLQIYAGNPYYIYMHNNIFSYYIIIRVCPLKLFIWEQDSTNVLLYMHLWRVTLYKYSEIYSYLLLEGTSEGHLRYNSNLAILLIAKPIILIN